MAVVGKTVGCVGRDGCAWSPGCTRLLPSIERQRNGEGGYQTYCVWIRLLSLIKSMSSVVDCEKRLDAISVMGWFAGAGAGAGPGPGAAGARAHMRRRKAVYSGEGEVAKSSMSEPLSAGWRALQRRSVGAKTRSSR